jgi:hypothetical protein
MVFYASDTEQLDCLLDSVEAIALLLADWAIACREGAIQVDTQHVAGLYLHLGRLVGEARDLGHALSRVAVDQRESQPKVLPDRRS